MFLSRFVVISAFLLRLTNAFRSASLIDCRRLSILRCNAAPLCSSTQSFGGEAKGAIATTTADVATTTAPRVLPLQSLDDFLDYIDSAPADSLSVIKFYSRSCPLCKRIEMKYKKMAHVYQNAPIRFAQVDKAINADFCTILGIDRFPYIQIYRNGQCVAAHGTDSDKTFGPIVNDTIQRELSMRQDEWDAFLTAFAEPIRQGSERIQNVRDLRKQS